MSQSIRKAVFPVAGMGTRFLPATKAMPKELLPIIDKPLIQYAVEEVIAAGITELVFVTGRTKRAIEDHFDANPELEQMLEDKGKSDISAMVHKIVPDGVNCIFLRQPVARGLGHAVLCAAPVVSGEPFAVVLADDVIRGGAPVRDLAAAYAEQPATYLTTMEVTEGEARKYGIVVPGETPGHITGLVEKPAPGTAPSLQASIGRYVLQPDILDVLHDLAPGLGGEVQLADAINTLAGRDEVRSVALAGSRYDCGSKFGYLEAIVDFALDHPEFGEDFLGVMKARVSGLG